MRQLSGTAKPGQVFSFAFSLTTVIYSLMTSPPEPEYEVRLNIRVLKKPLAYWQLNVKALKAEIENHHGIRAVFSIGSYVGGEPFLLTPIDRKAWDKPGYREKYDDVQAKVAAVVLKHDQS